MATPLLATKLYIPPARPELVMRPRLIERLNAGLIGPSGLRKGYGLQKGWRFARRLTLISAPAGFGKTTLASEWVQGLGRATPPLAIAWLSLDEDDNDLARFLV